MLKDAMLSGIKTGKRKRKAAPKSTGDSSTNQSAPQPSLASHSLSSHDNLSVAEQLRQNLATSGSSSGDAKTEKNYSGATSSTTDLPHQLLERSGRIQKVTSASSKKDDGNVTVVHLPAATSRAERLVYGENGGGGNNNMSVDEEFARNILRLGKKRKQKINNKGVDSDEEEYRLMNTVMPSTEAKSAAKQEKAEEKANRRELARELAVTDRQDKIVSRCWWWLESSQFAKHRLISLGNHVSLVMAPPNLSLTPGRHLYLVPIKHSDSLVGCEEEVWDELVRFQTSLRNMFEKEFGQGVLFSETVMPTKGFWQTKMEVIPIKRKLWLDSELYFKSTLTEQADEFGTHNKLMSTKGKGLRRTVPNNFPYFFIEWDSNYQGYAQIIESSSFPQDFAADTIAGMAGLDPVRFQRKKKFSGEQERQVRSQSRLFVFCQFPASAF